jgi:hypothetical protein
MRNQPIHAKIVFMLIHIVCWKYMPDVDEAARVEHRLRLLALKSLIPNIESLDVGSDILHLDRSFDTGLVADFPDRAALDQYTAHPEHQAVVAIGRAISEKVVSVDFMRPD